MKTIQAQITELETALQEKRDLYGEVEWGSPAHRQIDAIERKLEELDHQLKAQNNQ